MKTHLSFTQSSGQCQKKIAFILDKMYQGGPNRVFLNFLAVIDLSKYDITLFLFNPGGNLFEEIPNYVNIKLITPRGLFCTKEEDLFTYLVWFPFRFFIRLSDKIIRVFSQNKGLNWKLREAMILKDNSQFDVAISLIEGKSNYYLAHSINSKLKIGRIPTDYRVANLNKYFDIQYFKDLDYIATNSSINLNNLRTTFPSIAEKFILIETVILPELIIEKSNIGKGFTDNFKGLRILTLSRYDNTKGTDIAIDACKLLVEEGLNIKWYIMGDGSKDKFTQKIKEAQLCNNFIFMEPTSNPYPFIKECDIYVQPSRYEGNSNAVKEAKALCKPIVITNFNTASEHITHMKDGLIVDIDAKHLSKAILLLIKDDTLKQNLTKYLQINVKGNKEEFYKFLNLEKSDNNT